MMTLFSLHPPHGPSAWAERTFGKVELGDERRTNRLVTIAGELARKTGSSLSHCCRGDDAALEGAYHFIVIVHQPLVDK
ncbi:MAG: IS4/Tn5 family transposase DNA-binding protein [Enterobacteriaceae bacterium]